MKVIYKIKSIAENEPMVGTDFFKWLLKNEEGYFYQAIAGYCPDFDRNKHFLDVEQLDNHKRVMYHFWWMKHNTPELTKKLKQEFAK